MNHLNSNLAREAGRLAGWRERFWSRRYQAIVVSEEEAAQIERLKYVLAHGSKEGLVERPSDWPGVHAARPLAEGFSLEGYWFDRSREYLARRSGNDFDRLRFATRQTLTFAPLPCWSHLAPERHRELVADLLAQIETEACLERQQTGRTPPGRTALLKQHPHDRPNRPKRSPAPLFHAATRRVRRELHAAYASFVSAFRDAAERLRAGDSALQRSSTLELYPRLRRYSRRRLAEDEGAWRFRAHAPERPRKDHCGGTWLGELSLTGHAQGRCSGVLPN